jgi:hypothetical protein
MKTAKKHITTALILIISCLFTGCIIETEDGPPHCVVSQHTGVQFGVEDFPFMEISVENDGEGGKAYEVSCHVILKRGDSIIDEGFADFGDLSYRTSKSRNIYFNSVEKNTDYTSITITLIWHDADGNIYEE